MQNSNTTEETYPELWRETAIKCLRDEAQALLDLIPRLDNNYDRAVQIIHN